LENRTSEAREETLTMLSRLTILADCHVLKGPLGFAQHGPEDIGFKKCVSNGLKSVSTKRHLSF